jgi:DNA-binding CsgD family transcriptional regulator
MAGRMLEEFRRIGQRAILNPEEGHPVLTQREKEVLALVASGASNREAAHSLSVSIHTVKSHMRKIMNKLHVNSRHEATLLARREGLIPPPRNDPN